VTIAVPSGLTAALRKVVPDLEQDLRGRAESQPRVLEPWEREHRAASGRDRTAMSWQERRDDRVP
jgi:hypothetical protein